MDVAHRLRDSGYRMTPQRRLVWDALRAEGGHLTAEEIHARVRRHAPDINVASVYRTLSLLADLGMAKESQLGEGRGYWELAHPDDDFHLVCHACGTVSHHTGEAVEQVRDHLAADHGFTAETVDLVVYGLCDGCGTKAAL